MVSQISVSLLDHFAALSSSEAAADGLLLARCLAGCGRNPRNVVISAMD